MDELMLVERLRSEVPADIDVTGAERRWRRGALGGRPVRRRRPLLLSAVAATAGAAALGVVVLDGPDTGPMANVAAVLDQAADTASGDPVPGPGQIVYQDTVERRRTGEGRWYRVRTEAWLPAGGAGTGLIRQENSVKGAGLPPDGEAAVGPCPAAAPIDRPYLGGVPADPDALLDLMDGMGEGGRGERLWNAASDLIDRPAPPKVRAALFRAIADIPGVRLRDDGVDAAGRHGIAVTRTQDGVRDEFLFDRATHRFLGTRTVVAEPGNRFGAPGTTVYASALIRTEIVDRAPKPGPGAEPSGC